jgi:hypothetical protein
MIADFRDFCLWMYFVVDDIWNEIAPLFACPGPEPLCSHSEVMAMSLIGECRGWQKETEMLSHWRAYPDLFPHIPERSRFNRRRRNLMAAFNCVRQVVLHTLDLAHDRQCVIDSLPVPVVHFHLVPSSTGDWDTHGARFGKVPTKKQTIYGYKLHVLIGLNGLILDFILAPANESDSTVGYELLEEHTDLDVIGDKAFISAAKQSALAEHNRIHVLTLPKRNQRQQVSATTKHLLNSARQIVETVNGQLTEQFNVETNHAHSFWGLCTRLQTKLAAHTLCIYLNRLLGNHDFLQIKKLAFAD